MKQAAIQPALRPPKGEPFVWLSCMGLAIGLVMIIALLALVVIEGLDAFWPKRIAMVALVDGSQAGIGGESVLGGEIIKKQRKAVRNVLDDHEAPAPRECQLFVGNRDVYGFSFKYVDSDQISDVSYPQSLIKLERMEYGPAIGLAVRLDVHDREQPITADDPQFEASLRGLMNDVSQRRAELNRIERRQIGAINARMEELRYRQRRLERIGDNVAAAQELQSIETQLAALQEQYEVLSTRRAALRDQQTADTITYRLITGQERTIPLGQVVSFAYPNQLGVPGRIGLFLHNIWSFLSEEPREANTEGGIFPAIFGTFVMTILLSVIVTPFGVLAAIYLREYAKPGPMVRAVRIAINNLAGVPSIVFGVFGLGFFVYFVGGSIDSLFYEHRKPAPTFGTGGILWASLTLALMTVPVVIVATEEALAAVSRGMREGSLACGASKWQTIQRVVLPASAPGIITGMILAMARGAGEVAPLMLVGVVKLAPTLPVDATAPFIHLDRKFMHLGFHIYDLGFQSPDSEAARPMVFATTLLLIALVVVMNLGAIVIRERLRRKYSTGAF